MIDQADVIIVGTGIAGLFCALQIPEDKKVLMITKDALEHSDSFLAQGGICVLKGNEDYESYFEDTMKAGHYQNNPESVEVMIRTSPQIIDELIECGVEFERENGELIYTREAAHSTARILFHKDLTGKELTSKILSKVRLKKNIEIREFTTLIDLVQRDNICMGVIISDQEGTLKQINANYVVLASGGVGGLYESSTNYPHITGDAIAIAIRNNIKLLNEDYIQIHPTTLYSTKKERRFLISESVRGEGAFLFNAKGERFVDELLPRDILTKAIFTQMKIDKSKFVQLSMQHLEADKIVNRFPNIYKRCLDEGYDLTKQCIPVTPAQHYYMGGIKVDIDSKTSMEHLYAIGETSCNGVHGANRLASNSLLESLVFAKYAAAHITKVYEEIKDKLVVEVNSNNIDLDKLKLDYKKIILEKIERK